MNRARLLLVLSVCPAVYAWDTAGLRLNQLQVIGTHNSYKEPIEPALYQVLRATSDRVEALDYSHRSLSEQLDLGLRGLELDVVYDPEGGRYAKPRGLDLLRSMGIEPEPYDPEGAMLQPGFKVLHIPDIDFRSNCPTFVGALHELRNWSVTNPDHLPVVITMNLKDVAAPFPDATEPLEFNAAALDALDKVIRESLGKQRLITPDLVRGDAPTLEAAILERGWPLLDKVRGRFLWVLDERGEKSALYREGHPSLQGRVLFTIEPPDTPESAVLVMNNPTEQREEIRRLVRRGYFVRTRADSSTREARNGDTQRFRAACLSGAQVISTDYPLPDPRWQSGYCVKYEDGTYSRAAPFTAAESNP